MPRVAVAFLGQCHLNGYAGVPPDTVFPEVFRRAVEQRRPGVRVDLNVRSYYHPSELAGVAAKALRRRPQVMIVEVIGWLAIKGTEAIDLTRLPGGVRAGCTMLRHLRRIAQEIGGRMPKSAPLIQRVKVGSEEIASGPLAPLLRRYPRPTIEEYERCVDHALGLAANGGTTCVVQGPAAPNLALDSKRLASDAVERYRAVEEMARRVAEKNGALFVDRWDTVAGGFYLPGSIRLARAAHSVFGHLLADRIIAANLI